MKILHHKDEPKELKPIINNNFDFIAGNVIYPETHSTDQKNDVNLDKIMNHLGGTRGEIARLSNIYVKRTERVRENK